MLDRLLAPALRDAPPHELRRVRVVASLSILMQLLLTPLAFDGFRRGSGSAWFTVVALLIWASILPLLRLGHDRAAGLIAAAYPQASMLFIMLHRDSTALAFDPWQGVMIVSAMYLVGTRFGAITLAIVMAEIVTVPWLAQRGWLMSTPFNVSATSAIGSGTAFIAMFGLGWLYASARDAADRALEAALGTLSISREEFRSLVEQTRTIPLRIETASMTMLYVGPQAAALLGRPVSDWLTPSFLPSRVHPDDLGTVHDFTAKARLHLAWEGEFRLRHEDGSWKWVRAIISACRPGALDAHGVLVDVTGRRALESELQQAQKLESVGRLASGIAHEINTPVQFVGDSIHFVQDAFRDTVALLGSYRRLRVEAGAGPVSAQMLADVKDAEELADLDYLTENVPKALERSVEGLERVATLVRSMKEFAHPDQKEKVPADLNHALATTLTIARNEYRYVADIETDFGEIPPLFCHVNELNQVFLNLVVNSAHAIGDTVAGTDRRGVIRVSTRSDGEEITVSITDNGAGIPDAIRAKIFDPFFTTKPVGKGTGQGLAIARSIVVDKHQGRIDVTSELGLGTTFRLHLPLLAAQALAA